MSIDRGMFFLTVEEGQRMQTDSSFLGNFSCPSSLTLAGYIDSRICKHFLTHGCKLGIRCKFLHCTPEELASKIAQDNHAPQSTPPVSQGQQPAVESMDTSNNSATIEQNAS